MASPDRLSTASRASSTAWRPLLVALVRGEELGVAVPAALAIVDEDPLASAGCFRGDLLRGLMEVPGSFWGPRRTLYERYRSALRTAAALRRQLPCEERMEFWSRLDTHVSVEASVERTAERRSKRRAQDSNL